MWIILASLAALTSGVAVIFQKKGTYGKHVIQISAVHLSALFITVLLVTLLNGGLEQFFLVPARSWWLAVASGAAQAASWVAYFAAMKQANVSFLMVLDKTGVVVTMLLAAILLHEQITAIMVLGGVLILAGTFLMGDLCGDTARLFCGENRWILWGIVSPSMQALSNVLAKMDTAPVDTASTTTIRMFVVAVCLCLLSLIKEGSFRQIKELGKYRVVMLVVGGAVLGVSYLLMYKALSIGTASAVTAIVRANFLVTTVLAHIFLKERLSRRGVLGFVTVCFGVGLFLF